MIEWNIQSRSHSCQDCGKAFEDKQVLHTVLYQASPGFERLDLCDDCWKKAAAQTTTQRDGFISYWHSEFSVPPAAPPEAIQKESAETLLRKLIEQNSPTHAAARFVLAAMLERKRLLKVKAQSVQDKQRVFVYEHAKTGDLFTIADPNIQLDQLEAVQRDVARLLEFGLTSETESAPAPDDNDASHSDATEPDQTEPENQSTAAEEAPVEKR